MTTARIRIEQKVKTAVDFLIGTLNNGNGEVHPQVNHEVKMQVMVQIPIIDMIVGV